MGRHQETRPTTRRQALAAQGLTALGKTMRIPSTDDIISLCSQSAVHTERGSHCTLDGGRRFLPGATAALHPCRSSVLNDLITAWERNWLNVFVRALSDGPSAKSNSVTW